MLKAVRDLGAAPVSQNLYPSHSVDYAARLNPSQSAPMQSFGPSPPSTATAGPGIMAGPPPALPPPPAHPPPAPTQVAPPTAPPSVPSANPSLMAAPALAPQIAPAMTAATDRSLLTTSVPTTPA